MMPALARKLRQLAEDATLRRWLLARAFGRTSAPPFFTAHRPPYAASLELGAPPEPGDRYEECAAAKPSNPITLDLAGLDVTLHPGEEGSLFARKFSDVEQLLALHRFAWIRQDSDPAWVMALWRTWCRIFSQPDESWAWHPYTAAERVINLLGFARTHGLPSPLANTWHILAAHGPAIANHLEYFGPHYTGNHLANNGRGLFCLGTALGWAKAADLGGAILLNEAERIFGQSGVLIEGSSHYHLLLARNYALASSLAKEGQRPEAQALERIAAKAREAAGGLMLPGGLPLIGDISPDLPPADLTTGFPKTEADLSGDGWHRFEKDGWSMLLYTPPGGWPPMPGHGHQDLGGFELHWRGIPLIVDPGRGAYGETGEAALYRKASVHNTLTFSGRDPRPVNRPYYDAPFHRWAGGKPPEIEKTDGSLCLRFPMHGASVERRFSVQGDFFSLEDSVEGPGSQCIERRLVIPYPVEVSGSSATIATPAGTVRLTWDSPLEAKPLTRWTAYGRGQPATCLVASDQARLPWRGRLRLETV